MQRGVTRAVRRRRTLATLAAAGVIGLGPISAASASGDVVRSEGALDVSGQRIAMSWADGQQHMLVSYELTGESPTAAIVIATPTPPTITPGSPATFAALEDVTQPAAVIEERWWPDLDFLGGGSSAVEDPADAAVLEDGLVVNPLPAWDGGNIAAWLVAAGYPVSGELQAVLNTYTSNGWAITVVTVAGQDGMVSGELPPLDITFASDSIILPMLMTTTSQTPLALTTYVVGPTRMDRSDPDRASAAVTFAGIVSSDEQPELGDWLAPFGGAGYVTTTVQSFSNPERILGDFRFAESALPAVSAVPATVIVDRIIWGMPAGPVLVGGGMVVVALIGIGISQLLQRRQY